MMGMLVDLDDDGVLGEVDLVGEGAGANVGDDDSALDAHLGGERGGMAATLMPSLPSPASDSAGAALSSSALPRVGEQLGAVGDGDG